MSRKHVIVTLSGRRIAAPPSSRLKKFDLWLGTEAQEEARARGDGFAELQFSGRGAMASTPAHRDLANIYLFGSAWPKIQPV